MRRFKSVKVAVAGDLLVGGAVGESISACPAAVGQLTRNLFSEQNKLGFALTDRTRLRHELEAFQSELARKDRGSVLVICVKLVGNSRLLSVE